MRRLLRNKFILMITLAGLACGIYFYLKPSAANTAGFHGQPVPVSVAKVLDKEVELWREFSGKLVAVDSAEIRPRISGVIEAIHFQSGEIMNKGELLFTIDPRPYAAEVARAKGEVASAQAKVELARSELKRADRLIKEKAISQSDYDNRANSYRVCVAQLESAKAALETAKLNLGYTEIRAPVTGKISRPEITVGNLVNNGPMSPALASIVSLAPIYADFDVDEASFLKYIQNGVLNAKEAKLIPVKLGLLTEEGTPRSGRIDSFDNRLNDSSATIRVRAIFDNKDKLLVPGLFARIKMGDGGKTRVLLIAERAIGTDQSKKFVYAIDKDKKVAYREVKLGPSLEGLRIIEAGLKPEEEIILHGLQRVRPGQLVIPQTVSMEMNPSTLIANEG